MMTVFIRSQGIKNCVSPGLTHKHPRTDYWYSMRTCLFSALSSGVCLPERLLSIIASGPVFSSSTHIFQKASPSWYWYLPDSLTPYKLNLGCNHQDRIYYALWCFYHQADTNQFIDHWREIDFAMRRVILISLWTSSWTLLSVFSLK